MSQSLYRTYRSRTFDELVGQSHVTRTLTNAIAQDRIAHAYLFCGPRGTGKTSTARLLAKAANCLSNDPRPCNACDACRAINEGRALDLIEIDAASRRKVEDIAELIDRVNVRPAALRRKVYIIDEVHMLTAHAFNALLKTLEEPPPHALFILATTEVWKVLPTIVSRCQRFDFRRIPTADVVARLEAVAAAEGLTVEPAAFAAIARLSTGSLRDALGLLDQLRASGDEITLQGLQRLLGAVGAERVSRFADALVERDAPAALALLAEWAEEGMDARQFTQELVEYLRGVLLLKVSGPKARGLDATHEALEAMRALAERAELHQLLEATERFSTLDPALRTGPYGYLPIELATVAAAAGPAPDAPAAEPERQNLRAASSTPRRDIHRAPERSAPLTADAPAPWDEDAPAAPATAVRQPDPASREPAPSLAAHRTGAGETANGAAPPPAAPPEHRPPDAPPADTPAADGPVDLDHVVQVWPRVVSSLRMNRTVHALLRGCTPIALDGTEVTLRFPYEFHKAKIEERPNAQLVEQALGRALGRDATIRCTLEGERTAPQAEHAAPQADPVLSNPLVKGTLNIVNGKIIEISGGE